MLHSGTTFAYLKRITLKRFILNILFFCLAFLLSKSNIHCSFGPCLVTLCDQVVSLRIKSLFKERPECKGHSTCQTRNIQIVKHTNDTYQADDQRTKWKIKYDKVIRKHQIIEFKNVHGEWKNLAEGSLVHQFLRKKPVSARHCCFSLFGQVVSSQLVRARVGSLQFFMGSWWEQEWFNWTTTVTWKLLVRPDWAVDSQWDQQEEQHFTTTGSHLIQNQNGQKWLLK